MGTINDRIKCIADTLFNGNVSAFARQINVPQPTLKDVVGGKLSTPRFDLLEKIINDKSLNISSEWLLTGEGSMFRKNSCIESSNSIELPNVPEIDKAESSSAAAFLEIIKSQAETIKEITSSKERKLIENHEAIMKGITALYEVLKEYENSFNSIYNKLSDITSDKNISQEKKVS
ncbi:MAG: hypothetical protein EGP82_10185 [Odoribacter splanchnicus]|nr:hypothetical protein [Odoribacter splanchnicus]